MNYIAFDSHKHYTQACVQDASGNILRECRIEHERGALAEFLRRWEPGSPVALETLGNWYWIVDEIEEAVATTGVFQIWGKEAPAEGRRETRDGFPRGAGADGHSPNGVITVERVVIRRG